MVDSVLFEANLRTLHQVPAISLTGRLFTMPSCNIRHDFNLIKMTLFSQQTS